MAQSGPAVFKIPTKSPQPARGKAARPARRAKAARPAPGRVLANGTGRAATRGGGEVIELEYGITVYPAREEFGRWRAVWYENGERQQCEAASEEKRWLSWLIASAAWRRAWRPSPDPVACPRNRPGTAR